MSTTKPKGGHAGIVVKHRATCATFKPEAEAKRCNCRPSYQAAVWSARDGRRIRKHFDTLKDAQAWREDARGKLRRRELRAPSPITLAEAAEAWLAGVRDGSIRTRSGDVYKPSAVRSYELALRGRQDGSGGLLRDFGAMKLSEVEAEAIEAYAGRLSAGGASASTVRNAVMPLRAIYRWKARQVAVNPTAGLVLPAVRGGRDRIASPAEAERLLAALPEGDRALWATAMYGGLRRGELMGLRWSDVDLAQGVVRVEQAYDPTEGGMVAPKSRAGRRQVPIPGVLRDHLVEHRLRASHVDPDGLVFAGRAGVPFAASSVMKRARRAWTAAGVEQIGLHESRHTYASLMIAAGVNAKTLSTFMGHASVMITLDRYGHLFPGSEAEAAGLLDAYLAGVRERAEVAARQAAPGDSLVTVTLPSEPPLSPSQAVDGVPV